MKFNISITLLKNDSVRVEAKNPGAINPLTIIGLLDKVKNEIIFAMREEGENDDS